MNPLLRDAFWPIWILITAAAAIGAAVLIKLDTVARSQTEKDTYEQSRSHVARIGASGAVTTFTLLTVFLVCYIAMNLVWENFADHDNSIFTLYTLQGHDYPAPIWRREGRFFPLGVQEFNLVRHFTHTPIGYRILPVIQLLIFLGIIVSLGVELNIAARAILSIVVLLTPSVLNSFAVLTGQERDELFFLTCLRDLDSRTGFRHREWQKCWRLIKRGRKCGAKL